MARKPKADEHPLRIDHLVETEHKAGVDLAWIVVFGTILCVIAIAFAVPDAMLDRIADTSGLNVNGIIALTTVVPLGATAFAYRRYRDAVGAQRELTHLSLHDGLTGLPNRRHLREVLPEAFRHARRFHTRAAVLFVDLDGFKSVNDTHGHHAGDEVLVAVAGRVRHAVRNSDLVSRVGGDEFVVACPAPCPEEEAVTIAERILTALVAPIRIEAGVVAIGASIGIAVHSDETTLEQLIRKADKALYVAKREEPGRYRVS